MYNKILTELGQDYYLSLIHILELPAQELPAFERTGFTVVEWGGAEIS